MPCLKGKTHLTEHMRIIAWALTRPNPPTSLEISQRFGIPMTTAWRWKIQLVPMHKKYALIPRDLANENASADLALRSGTAGLFGLGCSSGSEPRA